jgi:RNA polymerase sigma-70 factor, ECF subfamily
MDSNAIPLSMEGPLESAELLARSLAGDDRCREELARACLSRVRRTVFLALGRFADADDVVQTALTRVFYALPTFRNEAKLTTWVDRIAVNAIRDHLRRKPLLSRLFSSAPAAETEAPRASAPDVDFEGRKLSGALRLHLERIKPDKRIALMLSAAYGYSVNEIAALTDCSVETAKKRLQHGRRELLSRIRKDPYLTRVLEERGLCGS